MAIIYSVIARRSTVLCRFAACIGNFSEVTDVVLAKIDVKSQRRSRLTLKSDPYLYHYITEGDLIFLCIAEAAAEEGFNGERDRAEAFAYLESINKKFEASYGTNVASNVIPFAMNTDFSGVMAAETKRSNAACAADREERFKKSSFSFS
jgi:vesicle-associated membrane protein 7